MAISTSSAGTTRGWTQMAVSFWLHACSQSRLTHRSARPSLKSHKDHILRLNARARDRSDHTDTGFQERRYHSPTREHRSLKIILDILPRGSVACARQCQRTTQCCRRLGSSCGSRQRYDANARSQKAIQYASGRYQANKGERRGGGPRHTKRSGFIQAADHCTGATRMRGGERRRIGPQRTTQKATITCWENGPQRTTQKATITCWENVR
jgi:hypothetical protein